MPTLFESIQPTLGVFEGECLIDGSLGHERMVHLPDHLHAANFSSIRNEGSDVETAHGHEFCKYIASRATSESDFPAECMKYKDAVALFKRHNSNNPYAGMSPGEAVDAMRAKSEGRMNSAQIKRRMTTRKNGRTY